MTKLNLNITQERLKDHVTLNELIGIQDGDLRMIRDLMARFVVNGEGSYLEEDEARSIIGSLTLGQLEEVSGEFQQKMEQVAVPFESGKVSV